LRVLLKRREEDRIELEENVLSNVKETVIPFLKKTRQCRLDDDASAFLGVAESNLNDIVTPFMRGIFNRYSNLTPTEVQIVNFVLQGKRTKEIAESLHVSPRTVEFHRNNIRKKLGIDGKKVNLRTHLLSLQ
jgi:DNA-binding CsgD family transcriptional regulator